MGEYFRQAYNRGYGQPLITGRENSLGTTPFLTFLERRWNYDWLKLIAMRIDAERTPLMVLKRQPMTWTGRDLQHGALWLLNVAAFFSIGEMVSRQYVYGYPVATPEWTPSKPKFVPGFYHVYDPFENY